MKKLISAKTIIDLNKNGSVELSYNKKETIITPEARTIAEKYNINLIETDSVLVQSQKQEIDEKLIRQVVTRVIKQLPEEKHDYAAIKQAVIDVIQKRVI